MVQRTGPTGIQLVDPPKNSLQSTLIRIIQPRQNRTEPWFSVRHFTPSIVLLCSTQVVELALWNKFLKGRLKLTGRTFESKGLDGTAFIALASHCSDGEPSIWSRVIRYYISNKVKWGKCESGGSVNFDFTEKRISISDFRVLEIIANTPSDPYMGSLRANCSPFVFFLRSKALLKIDLC